MRIVNLLENTPGAADCLCQHGLSLWIETSRHRLLMDFGPSEALLHNAQQLGIDLSKADAAFLSHGHYDHADGIGAFASVNRDAPVYLRCGADGAFYSGSAEAGTLHYIGLSPALAGFSRFNWVSAGYWEMDESISLFSGIPGRRNWPESNLRLSVRKDGGYVQDDFSHEQCLVICENGKTVLLSGCAHNGILNILDRFRELYGCWPDVVLSGFHMMKSAPYTPQEIATIRRTAQELRLLPCTFHTCHCTGLEAYDIMKEIMGGKLRYFHTGDEISL